MTRHMKQARRRPFMIGKGRGELIPCPLRVSTREPMDDFGLRPLTAQRTGTGAGAAEDGVHALAPILPFRSGKVEGPRHLACGHVLNSIPLKQIK